MILITDPPSRVNDNFIKDNRIDATPLSHSVRHDLISGRSNDPQTRFQANFYRYFALDIVTETVFAYPYPCVTEKTLRPMASKRMFVVLGPARILSLLHSKGFETFGDFLDESYDDIVDHVARFHQVADIVRGFVQRPLAEIQAYYQKNHDRFEHNFNTLANLRARELVQIAQQLGMK